MEASWQESVFIYIYRERRGVSKVVQGKVQPLQKKVPLSKDLPFINEVIEQISFVWIELKDLEGTINLFNLLN